MVEKMQREQKARERRRNLIGGAVVVVLLLAIAGGVFFSVHKSRRGNVSDSRQVMPSTPTGSTTTQVKPSTVKNPTDIKGVVAYNTGSYPGPGHATAPTRWPTTTSTARSPTPSRRRSAARTTRSG